MTKTAIAKKDRTKLKIVRKRIGKRALFLFIFGYSYIVVWPADILHFYAVYMAVTMLFLTSKERIILIVIFPILMVFLNYETGWNFDTLAYTEFWSLNGFFRNLFYNGFHPVIPWVAFMLFGYWFGKQDLHNDKFIKKTFWISTGSFVFIQIVSFASISFLSQGNQESAIELTQILGTTPMPPLPVYMINGIAIAFAVISGCILISKRFENSFIIDALHKTGQLAFTFYVAHVIIGMGILDAINPYKMGSYSVEFSVICALAFSLACVVFAIIWRKYKKVGPIEWMMRKLTD